VGPLADLQPASSRYSLVNVKTPSLLLHGEKDIHSTPEIFYALSDLQVPVEFVTYPREGHSILCPFFGPTIDWQTRKMHKNKNCS
jgi:dipeptidyl aminopeptidase/acylaminoacyl peptidase